jgi:hypothetical protein
MSLLRVPPITGLEPRVVRAKRPAILPHGWHKHIAEGGSG